MTEAGLEPYDYRSHKIIVIFPTSIEVSIALRALGHLGVALGAHVGNGILGRKVLIDATGREFRGICKFPVVILQGKPLHVQRAMEEAANDPKLSMVAFTQEMLDTGHDDELAHAMRASTTPLALGIIVFGPLDDVNRIGKRFSVWRAATPQPPAP